MAVAVAERSAHTPYRHGGSRVPAGGVFRRLRRRRGRRPSFGHWARLCCRRLVLALVFAMFLPVFTASLSAQPPAGASMGVCMRNNSPEFQSGGDFAPDDDPRSLTLIPLNSLVEQAIVCAEAFAATNLVPIGMNIWAGLAVIIVIWTGIQMMFGSGLAMGQVVSLILLLGFPWAILQFYNTSVNTPWGDATFTTMVTGMGALVGSWLVDGAFETLVEGVVVSWNEIWNVDAMATAAAAAAPEGWQTMNPGAWVVYVMAWAAEVLRNFLTVIQMVLVMVIVIVLLVLPAVVAYCSYLWGYLSIMVSVVLGPLLVPWFLVPQLQFLAWGWFRSLLGATIHLMVAGAVFAVVAQILTIPLIRVGQNVAQERGSVVSLGIDAGMLLVGGWRIWWKVAEVLVESLPLIVVAYLGVFKIGEISSMIMNGGSMPASGIGERMQGGRNLAAMRGSAAGAISGAGAKAAAIATGVGAAAVAAGAVLSQATKRT